MKINQIRQDWFCQENARVKWYAKGDKNTCYFHKISKTKSTSKAISTLHVGDVMLNDQTLIEYYISFSFESLFTSSNEVFQDHQITKEVTPNMVDDGTNALLTMIHSPLVIKNDVFSYNKYGAPGPDDFRAFFFQLLGYCAR